ncbi:MAG: carboxypeptidase-like regulatory domain-containing protein [Planctomycetota bacterium]
MAQPLRANGPIARRSALLVGLVALSALLLWGIGGGTRRTGGPGDDARVSPVVPRSGDGEAAELRSLERAPGLDAAAPLTTIARRAAAPLEPSEVDATAVVPRSAFLRVVDALSEEPVVGADVADVWVAGQLLEVGWESEPSDESGQLTVRWNGPSAIDVAIAAEGYVTGIRPDLASEGGEELPAVALLPTARIEVSAVGFAPNLEGRALLFERADARRDLPDRSIDWRGESSIVFDDVTPGLASVVLYAQNSPAVLRPAIETQPGETTRVELVARRGETVRGRVVERTTRSPLGGVHVRPAPAESGLSRDVERMPFEVVITGADGSFELVGLPPGEVKLELTSDFGPAVEREIVVVEGDATRVRELAINGAATVSGRVVLPDGVAAGEVTLAVVATSEVGQLSQEGGAVDSVRELSRRGTEVPLSADGTFRCDRAPVGRSVSLLAVAGGALGATVLKSNLRPGEVRRDIEVELAPLEPVVFRVTDVDGSAVDRVRVAFRWALGKAAAWATWEDLVAREGTFRAPIDAAGVRRVRLRADGFLPLDVPWPKDVQEGEPPVFVLQPSYALDVFVRDESGLAIEGARAIAALADNGPSQGRKAPRRSARTDAFGRVRIEVDRVGSWSVEAHQRGFRSSVPVLVTISEADTLAEIAVTLEREPPPSPATVRGRFVRRGDGAPPPAFRFDGLRGGSARIDGPEFELIGIRPGASSIVVRADGYESVRLPIDRLAAGETVDVGEIVTVGATRLSVRVRDGAGRSLRSARDRLVRLRPSTAGRPGHPPRLELPRRKDAAGTYRRSDVPRARWRLVVESKGFRRSVREVDVSGGRATIDVRLVRR